MNITNLIVAALRVLRILLFLVGITIPLVGFYFNWQGGGKLESKGKRIALPAIGVTPLEWGRYVLKYRALFNDEFGFRKGLIRLHAITRFKLFGIASNDKVLLGKQGWFYMGKYFDSIEYARHQRPFSEHELQSWKQILERRRDALRKRGIHYIFAVAPNKESIYPEYLPGWYTRVTRQSRLDQLLQYMREHSDVKIIDLRTPLLAAKKSTPLFYKTDSHWNAYGACAGCESIIAAVRESELAKARYRAALEKSWVWEELKGVRNIRPGFNGGMWLGLAHAAIDTYLFRGKAPWTLHHQHADNETLVRKTEAQPIEYPKADGVLTFDRLSSVFLSGTNHEENQPAHLTLVKNVVNQLLTFLTF